MQKKKVFCLVLVVLTVGLIFGGGNFAWSQAPEDDIFAVIKLHNPEAFIPKVGQLIDKFQPGMGGMVNPMMVGNMVFKNPNWAGMDMAGEYMAVVLNPMKYPSSPYALIVPLTSTDEYLGALSQTLTGGEETGGVYTFMQPNQKPMFVVVANNMGVLAEDQQVAAQVKTFVEGQGALFDEIPGVKGQLVASLSVTKILAAVRPMLEMFRQQMLMGLEQQMQPQEGEMEEEQPPAAAVKNVLQAETDMLLSLLDQTEKLNLGFGLEDDGLRLSKAVFAMDDSNMAKFMAAQTPKQSKLLGLVPADSGIIMSGSFDLTQEFIDGYLSFLDTMSAQAEGVDQDAVSKVADWAKLGMEVFGGEFVAGALSAAGENLLTEIITLKDAGQAKQLVEQYPDMLQSMLGMYGDMGMDFTMTLADRADVTGGEIFNFDFGVNAASIPDPEGQEVFTNIFGDSMTLPIGFVADYGVVGFGKNARQQVEQVMELVDSGADVAAKYTPAMFGLPEENNLFMYVSVPNMMAWAQKYLPEAPQFEVTGGSPGLAMAARFAASHFEGELFLPVEELLAIKSIVEQAQAAEQGTLD